MLLEKTSSTTQRLSVWSRIEGTEYFLRLSRTQQHFFQVEQPLSGQNQADAALQRPKTALDHHRSSH